MKKCYPCLWFKYPNPDDGGYEEFNKKNSKFHIKKFKRQKISEHALKNSVEKTPIDNLVKINNIGKTMSKVTFHSRGYTDNQLLCCPNCNEYYLHQTDVEVFNRDEDKETGTHVVIQDDTILIDKDVVTQNPSSRRNGLKITFWCEFCGDEKFELAIYQHKGATMMKWLK